MKTTKLLLILFLSFLFVLSSCSDKKKKEYDLAIQKGDSLFVSENYEKAISYYKQAQMMMPKEAHAKDKLKEIESLQAQKAEEAFQELLLTANDYYNQGEFEAARTVYLQLAKLKPNKTDIQDRIAAIDIEMDKNKVEEVVSVADNFPYHIIVGSFIQEDNAVKLQEELVASGFSSRIFNRPDGFSAVSIHSYETIHEAYNKMEVDTNSFSDVWVIRE